jgi:hypothetical protein
VFRHEFHNPKQGKKFISIYFRPHLVFEVQSNSTLISNTWIFICGVTANPYCVQLQIKMNTHFTNVIFMAVTPIETAPKPSKECDSPRSEVLTGALIELEEILCVLCESWLHKQEELKQLL